MAERLEIDLPTAARAFGERYFNLIRRGADGSLVLSADRWRATALVDEALEFVAQDETAPPLRLLLADVDRVTWDRLPRQQVRSQIRFYLTSGDLWTFSGTVDETVLPRARES